MIKLIKTILEVLKYILSSYEEKQKQKEQETHDEKIQQNREEPVEFFENKFGRNDNDDDNSLLDKSDKTER